LKARRIASGFLTVLLLAILLALFNHQSILQSVGQYLVEAQPPEKSDAVLVLAGDHRGQRIQKAAELVRDGYAPVALISGPMEMYGVNEADLAIQFAERHGSPARYFAPVYITAYSTLEEAQAFAPELRKRNIHKLLLVTSTYHTRRAAATFRRVLGSSMEIKSVAAPDPFFRPDSWWHNREGQKTVFYEYSKTVANWLGM
jgi:uncharacterized SAM-binding protein YcdF (DUF218 family)